MKKYFFIVVVFVFFACKKSEDRNCFKTYGDYTEYEIPLDSTSEFRLSKRIKYNFYQDTLRKIVVKSGQNMINSIDVSTVDYVTTISNNNSCYFLRDNDHKIQVDVHYPFYRRIYSEASDSVIFKDIIKANVLSIEIRNGAGVVDVEVDVNDMAMSVSYGVGSYILKGKSKTAVVSVQNKGRGNALGFSSNKIRFYQNSNNDLLVNVDSSDVEVWFNGNGDILYSGNPDTVVVLGQGDGEFLPY